MCSIDIISYSLNLFIVSSGSQLLVGRGEPIWEVIQISLRPPVLFTVTLFKVYAALVDL